ncbi:transposase family protein [Streptomyces sp. NPDC005799]|uniref:transposase family protein n=1 Tax=Streptomyces sp. NPDC005799 TaxID=3154678 RepID=UPI0033C21258
MSSSRISVPVRAPVPDHELLVDLLGRIPDPRRRRGIRHPAGALIAVAVCAVMAGARGFTAIGEWARDAGTVAMARLGLERGAGSGGRVDDATPVREAGRGPSRRRAGGVGRNADHTRRGPTGDRDRRQDCEGCSRR